MRIYVKDGKHKIYLILPTGLVLNRFTAAIIGKASKTQEIPITKDQANQLFSVINQYRRAHRDWVLAEVDSADGTKIFVKL